MTMKYICAIDIGSSKIAACLGCFRGKELTGVWWDSTAAIGIKQGQWHDIQGLTACLSRLLKNLSDESSIELQRSIALILERTAKYENDKIKKRVISLLKIRCEMSQDPIICGTLHKLSES